MNDGSSDARNFSATRWSVVLAASGDARGAQEALSTLCRAYWYPLYAFARRQGLASHDAEDATQGFFAHLLGKDGLAHVDRAKGRFRTFLLVSFKHFLADERDRAQALKRGGGVTFLSIDSVVAEQRYVLEPHDEMSPDRVFDRRWARTVIEQAMARLSNEYSAVGQAALFAALSPQLGASANAAPYAEIARNLDLAEGAVKVAAHRLRRRYGAALRAEIAETVATASEVDAELRHLLEALG